MESSTKASVQERIYRPFFELTGRLSACRPEETIVIAGVPRSGTTLLMEIFWALPDHKGINEPLLKPEVRQKHGFGYRSFLSPGDQAAAQRDFLDRVLKGQVGPDFRWSFNGQRRLDRLRTHASQRRLVLKFCRINRLLQWFDGQFRTRGTLLVIRHPCATVSSMLSFRNAWNHGPGPQPIRPGSPLDLTGLPDHVQERFGPIIDSMTTYVEELALMWCLDYYVPFYCFDEHPWTLVPYERLIIEGVPELRRISALLGLESTPAMERLLEKPSSSTISAVEAPREQIAKWRQHLTKDQIDAILSVVERAGLSHLYHADPEPNYTALNLLQRPESRWPDEGVAGHDAEVEADHNRAASDLQHNRGAGADTGCM